MSPTPPEFTDGVIFLRAMTLADAPAHLAGDDAENIRWLGDGHASTIETVTAWIERCIAEWETGAPKRAFGICDATTGALTGCIEYNVGPGLDGVPDGDANLSYTLYPPFRGRGLVTRAVELICEHLSELGVHAAYIRAEAENVASVRVAQRSGFTHAGEIVTRDGHTLQCYRRQLSQPT